MDQLSFQLDLPAPVSRGACASYDSTIRAAVQQLSQVTAPTFINHWDILERADPEAQTVYFASALSAIIEQHQNTLDHAHVTAAYPKVLEFLQAFDPIQARYVGTSWRRIVEFALAYADRLHVQDSLSAAVPVRDAILRLDPTGSILTSSHIHFLAHCLQRKAFSLALPLLDKDIYHIPCAADEKFAQQNSILPCNPREPPTAYITRESGLTDRIEARQVLEYFLYGAMLYIGVRNWERAIHFLNIVLRTPTRRCASAVQIEAYKKWILANLIHHGTVPDINRDVTKHVVAYMSPLAKPYEAVAEVFQRGSYDTLVPEIEIGKHIWEKDYNASLMKQVAFAYRKHAVTRLGKIVNAIPIPDATARLAFDRDRMEAFLHYLIANDHLKAAITTTPTATGSGSGPKILRFSNSSNERTSAADKMTEAEFQQLVREKRQTLDALLGRIQVMRRKIVMTGEFLTVVQKVRSGKELGGGGARIVRRCMGGWAGVGRRRRMRLWMLRWRCCEEDLRKGATGLMQETKA